MASWFYEKVFGNNEGEQSTGDNGQKPAATTKMRCHYEVMVLARDATTEEIKKQYKKLALQHHPDRNFGKEEAAAIAFKEVSAAYAVLSDPQERKWYDDHREAILRGKHTGGGDDQDEDYDDYTPDLYAYFSTSCFDDFDDSPNGFYAIYNQAIDKIIRFEESNDGKPDYPLFGNTLSMDSDVLNFYNIWENFVTEANFAWVDKYNVLEAPNRQVRRAMEKENTKLRDNARKEYNGNIRALILFMKKRDIRMKTIEENRKKKKLDEENVKIQQKQIQKEKRKEMREQWKASYEEESAKRDEERKRAFLLADNDSEDEEINEVNRAVAEMELNEAVPNATYEFQEFSAGNEASNDAEAAVDNEEEQYCCEICEKSYKTEMQLNQHLASKVHRKKVQDQQKKQKKGAKSKGKSVATAAGENENDDEEG